MEFCGNSNMKEAVMATVTTVTRTERAIERRPGFGRRSGPGGNNGFGRNGGGSGGGHDDGSQQALSGDNNRLAVWVILAAVVMMFTALSSAYIVRSVSIDGSNDWQPIAMPRLLWLSTAIIVSSSFTFRQAQVELNERRQTGYYRWIWITGILGLGFLVSQLLAWRELREQGIYLASNPHSSFFYLLTAAHGVHLACGILALGYLLIRSSWSIEDRSIGFEKRKCSVDAVAIYWHFMDGLWIYLFLLLFFWRWNT
jgi:cytochrome c oxidase subunit 3